MTDTDRLATLLHDLPLADLIEHYGADAPSLPYAIAARLIAQGVRVGDPPPPADDAGGLRAALEELLDDTQHADHDCGDADCPVAKARAALAASPEARPMSGWYRYLPWWAKVYWRTSAGDARFHLPWPRRIHRAGADAWVSAYMAWKRDGYR